MLRRAIPLLLLALAATPAAAAAQEAWRGLEVKYVRDSEEYATLARQVYRAAERAMLRARDSAGTGARWAAVLDVDETALDNSVYELERDSYGMPFDTASWNAWIARREAGAVPGVADFVAAVRRAGGRVAWITNRDETTREDTRANMASLGLWTDTDRLCLLVPADTSYTKARRRAEVARGAGRCSWEGEPVTALVYIGDAMGDFPTAKEALPGTTGDAAFGSRFFLIPNPLYGGWTRRVTRTR